MNYWVIFGCVYKIILTIYSQAAKVNAVSKKIFIEYLFVL